MSDTSLVAEYLEAHLREHGSSKLLHYSDLTAEFEDLPSLSGAWRSHPLCRIFDELDREDADFNRPFRTAIVVNRETFQPGPGFYESYSRFLLDGRPITPGERVSIHATQLSALDAAYCKQ